MAPVAPVGDAVVNCPFEHSPVQRGLPYFAASQKFDESAHIVLGARAGLDFSIATHRRDRAGLGQTVPTPVAPAYLAMIQLRPGGTYDLFCDARHQGRADLRTGGLSIMDMRHLWVADLPHPFHSFSLVVPQSLLDELTEDLGQPRITALDCLVSAEREDPVMLAIARATYPALNVPGAIGGLVLAHLFQAASVHLAQTYGGLKAPPAKLRGGLTLWQERRAKELLDHDLCREPTLESLSVACNLTPFRFARAFRHGVGVTPHRWLMERRIESAKNLLAFTAEDTGSIARFCGFACAARFANIFTRIVGAGPEAWRHSRRH